MIENDGKSISYTTHDLLVGFSELLAEYRDTWPEERVLLLKAAIDNVNTAGEAVFQALFDAAARAINWLEQHPGEEPPGDDAPSRAQLQHLANMKANCESLYARNERARAAARMLLVHGACILEDQSLNDFVSAIAHVANFGARQRPYFAALQEQANADVAHVAEKLGISKEKLGEVGFGVEDHVAPSAPAASEDAVEVVETDAVGVAPGGESS